MKPNYAPGAEHDPRCTIAGGHTMPDCDIPKAPAFRTLESVPERSGDRSGTSAANALRGVELVNDDTGYRALIIEAKPATVGNYTALALDSYGRFWIVTLREFFSGSAGSFLKVTGTDNVFRDSIFDALREYAA